MIKNPSFESESPSPWVTSGDGITILTDPEIARSGQRSAAISFFEVTNSKQRPEVSQPIKGIENDRNYQLELYFTILQGAPSINNVCELKIQLYGGSTFAAVIIQEGVYTPETYYELEFPFGGSQGSSTDLEVIVSCQKDPPQELKVAVDDFRIVEQPLEDNGK
ncbi:hypothetical protein NW762_008249 [Fusarium torreyae]|uniref:Uncharacterized protein n=1 Tax=Fusarium torreyae TaxID=1237075 RepID=A0A9W8VFR8_9HYPO|nr:hypothetical protein NW762_008249 [Fusarium torreyae]